MFEIYVEIFDLINTIATCIENSYQINNEEYLELITISYEILVDSIIGNLELPNEIKDLIIEKAKKIHPIEIIEPYEKMVKKFLENDRKSHIPLPRKYYEKGLTSYQNE